MSLRVTLRALVCCLALFALSGCADSPVEENAECSQGATRVEKCGLYGVGLQQQVCGPRYRWINEGSCVEQTVCEHRETRREPCGGLNDTAYREQRCDLGQWPETWGACTDPDVCVNGEETDELCAGEDAGLNARARRELVCENGQWTAASACIDPDLCTKNNTNPDECAVNERCILQDDSYICACRENFVEDEHGVCYLPPVCEDGETTAETCEGEDAGLNGRAERLLVCEDGQWAVQRGCVDPDECTQHGSDCHPDATCNNDANPASFTCQCDAGFVGDGQLCTNIDECADSELHQCSPLALCTDTPGAYRCACFPGTVDVDGDGKTCRKFIDLSLGANHTCGVTEDSEIYCWGRNHVGQLGDGTTTSSARPIRLSTAENWSRIAAGGNYTRALNRADAFVYWGGASSDQTVPGYNVGSTMTTLASFSAEELSVGRAHTCALTSGPRELFCWGYNESGQLGDKTTASKSAPTKIAGPEGSAWSAISAGGQHTCAMNNYGWFYCWGAGNKGQLGNSAWTGSTEPVRIAQSLSLTKIVAGDNHTCAIAAYSDNYRLYCWGDNGEGQLGVGGFSSKWSPTAVSGGMAWNQVALGASHTCAITGSGHLYCWGANDKGQLGLADPSVVQKDSPQRVGTNDDWRAIRAGGDHTCGLRGGSGGSDPAFLYCWGANETGQAGQSGSPKVYAPAALPTD